VLTYNQHFEYQLRKLIEAEIERLEEILSLGLSVPDFHAYRHIVGQIAGLRRSLEFCEEANSIANQS